MAGLDLQVKTKLTEVKILDIILASASPRRQELLTKLIANFSIIPADVDETIPPHLTGKQAVEYLSEIKAAAVAKDNKNSIVIGADTVVVYQGQILGKPIDRQDCINMISLLSGKTHQVYTGISIITPDEKIVFSHCTDVTFDNLSYEYIQSYSMLDEPYDKAGGYGIQGVASIFISQIKGDYWNVMGLPVNSLYKHIKKMKIHTIIS